MSSSLAPCSIRALGKLVAMVAGWMVELNSIVHTALRHGLVMHYLRHLAYAAASCLSAHYERHLASPSLVKLHSGRS